MLLAFLMWELFRLIYGFVKHPQFMLPVENDCCKDNIQVKCSLVVLLYTKFCTKNIMQ